MKKYWKYVIAGIIIYIIYMNFIKDQTYGLGGGI